MKDFVKPIVGVFLFWFIALGCKNYGAVYSVSYSETPVSPVVDSLVQDQMGNQILYHKGSVMATKSKGAENWTIISQQ